MQTINVTFRMDKKDKQEFESIINDLGLNLSSAFNIFAKAVIRKGGVPFELQTETPNEETQRAIERAKKGIDLEEMSLDELVKIAKKARDNNV